MSTQQTPHLCYTAAGMLIHEGKVLLVKHKKLQIWLNPGGHIEANELPHQAAEREFFEETGVRVEAYNPGQISFASEDETVYYPSPILTNVHWVNRESYALRLQKQDTSVRVPTKLWPRGCEQHLSFLYLVRPLGALTLVHDATETDGIEWFTTDQLASIPTKASIRQEIALGFSLLA